MPSPTKHSPCVGIRTCSDYSPFGVELDGRTVSGGYRYGFQNQEKDDEMKGEGNSVNYTFRIHDPRLGRFFAVDPLSKSYPYNSPYAFSENSTIAFLELEGLEKFYAVDGTYLGSIGNSQEIRVLSDVNLWRTYKSLQNQSPIKSKQNRSLYNKQNDAKKKIFQNSSKLYTNEQLWDELINWGNKYLPLSKKFEQGMMIYSRTFTDESGTQFEGYVFGTTISNQETDFVQPLNSSLIIGKTHFGGRQLTELGVQKYLEPDWNRYAIVHTHTSGIYSKQFSWNDFGLALELNTKIIMFSVDSKSMYKFESWKYNKEANYDFKKTVIGEYSENFFEKEALKEATYEYKNVVN